MNKNTPKVLVIDDEPLVLEVFLEVLREAGLEVLGAASATEAMRILSTSFFDVVVSDLHLQPFDGFEIGRFAREQREGTPVVIITGRPEHFDEIQATEEGMSFLTKPVSLPLLVGHVCSLCAMKQYKKKWIAESARYVGA